MRHRAYFILKDVDPGRVCVVVVQLSADVVSLNRETEGQTKRKRRRRRRAAASVG